MAKATQKDQPVPTLAEIRAQMAELQKQEAELLAKERDPIIAQMKENISTYSITSAELGFTLSMGQKIAKATTKKKADAVVMYRDGDNTWAGGRGRRPQWVNEKIAAGEDIEKYKLA